MARKKVWIQEKRDKAIEFVLNKIEEGVSLRSILSNSRDKELLPSRRVFNKWLSEDNNLSTQYARACEIRADVIFEDILHIADDNGKDTRVTKDGVETTDHDVIQRSKLRVDARKWYLSKLNPKKYGNQLDLTTQGDKIENAPIFGSNPLDEE